MTERYKKISISLSEVQNSLDAFWGNDPKLYRRALDAIWALRDKVYYDTNFASPEWSNAKYDWIDGFIIIFEAWDRVLRIHQIYTSETPLPPFAGFAVKAEAGHIRIKLSDVRDPADAFRNLLQVELGQLDQELQRRDELTYARERAAVESLSAQVLAAFAPSKRGPENAAALLQLTLAAMHEAKQLDFFGLQMALDVVLARHQLALRDYSGALDRAAQAVTLATRFGFLYKKIGLRRLIGRIMVARGDVAAGQALLRHASLAPDVRLGSSINDAHPSSP